MPVKVITSEWAQANIVDLPREQFAVGDVHGHAEELSALLQVMAAQASNDCDFTFLGDLIDRGPNSLGALDAAANLKGFTNVHYLLGNHEVLFLLATMNGSDALDAFNTWIGNGGNRVLNEFGPDAHEEAVRNRFQTMSFLYSKLPEAVKTMFDSMRTYRMVGNLVFVHAGVKPNHPIKQWLDESDPFNIYDEDTPVFIRFPFLRHADGFEGNKLIVHGHTMEHSVMKWIGLPPSEYHKVFSSRLNLDGGSYETGKVVGAQLKQGAYRTFIACKVD